VCGETIKKLINYNLHHAMCCCVDVSMHMPLEPWQKDKQRELTLKHPDGSGGWRKRSRLEYPA